MNNETLGMVRQWQTVIYKKNYFATTLDRAPDFCKLADAYGLNSARATTVEELENALTAALKSVTETRKGFVIDCSINIDEMVRPMVAGGANITDFIVH